MLWKALLLKYKLADNKQLVNSDSSLRSCSRDPQTMAENHSFRSVIFDNSISGMGAGTVKLERD